MGQIITSIHSSKVSLISQPQTLF